MKVTKIGCNVLVIQNGKLLLGQRKNIKGDGQWGLPGGHLEYGELLHEAAARELFEETGIKTDDLLFESVINSIQEDAHYIQVNFVLKDFKGEVENKEQDYCYEFKFFKMSELPENIFYAHKDTIEKFINKIVYY